MELKTGAMTSWNNMSYGRTQYAGVTVGVAVFVVRVWQCLCGVGVAMFMWCGCVVWVCGVVVVVGVVVGVAGGVEVA